MQIFVKGPRVSTTGKLAGPSIELLGNLGARTRMTGRLSTGPGPEVNITEAGRAASAGAAKAMSFLGSPLRDVTVGSGTLWGIIDAASVALSAYHGYKRNQSVGWAVVWALLGGVFPVITPAVAFAQGFGKRKS